MKKCLVLWVFAIFLFGALAGCGSTEDAMKTDEKDTKQHALVTDGKENYYPLTVLDASGTEVTIEKEPETIISLVPSNTEIVHALGIFNRLIAVSDNDDFPAEVSDLPSIGGMEFNVEQVIAYQPDVVLASEINNPDGLEQIKNAGIKVVVVNGGASFADVYQSIELIGRVTGTAEKAAEVINNMQAKLTEVKEAVSNLNVVDEQPIVWVEIWPGPEMYTTGKGTFMHEMLEEYLLVTNAAGTEEGWPMFTEEDAVILNPDIIITTYGHVEGMENAVEDVLARPAWSEVSAVKQERVYNIEANIVERPGPRLVEGVEKLAEYIYPEITKK